MRTKIGLLGLAVVGLIGASLATSGSLRAAVTTIPTHHHHHHIHGKIISIDSTSITIRVHHRKKGAGNVNNANQATVTKTFKLTGNTKFGRMTSSGMTAIAATELRVGQHVVISAHKGVAHTIAIAPRHHKKPAA